MNIRFFLFLLILFPLTAFAQRTQLIVLGTVHPSGNSFNSDSLVHIFNAVKPDIILMELDSSFFNADFELVKDVKENEFIAVKKYKAKNDVMLRPYEYTGRNTVHRKLRVKKNYKEVLTIIDTLYRQKKLSAEQKKIVEEFYKVGRPLDRISEGGPRGMNNNKVDSLSQVRQYYYYTKLKEIVNEREELSAYREFYKAYSDFWEVRNQTMVKHISKFIDDNPGKKIIVLTGFLHRYYLLNELKPLREKKGFELKEYYDAVL